MPPNGDILILVPFQSTVNDLTVHKSTPEELVSLIGVGLIGFDNAFRNT